MVLFFGHLEKVDVVVSGSSLGCKVVDIRDSYIQSGDPLHHSLL